MFTPAQLLERLHPHTPADSPRDWPPGDLLDPTGYKKILVRMPPCTAMASALIAVDVIARHVPIPAIAEPAIAALWAWVHGEPLPPTV